jgi:hypothetical protein
MPPVIFLFLTGSIFYFSHVSLGFWVTKSLKYLSVFERILIGTVITLVFFVSSTALLGQLIGPVAHWTLLIYVALGVWQHPLLWKQLPKLFSSLKKAKTTTVFLLFAVVSLVSTVALSGVPTARGIAYQETHDNLWHVALAQELQKNIPPNHPSFSSIQLENYHYFYDLLLASYATVSHTPVHYLYFQFFSSITALLLVGAAFICGRKIKNTNTGNLLVFFTLFAGSFAYAIPWFLPGQMWHESSFWVSQTFVMMLNPQIIFTLAVTYIVLFLLQHKQHFSWKTQGVIIFLIATSIGFKSYAWVVLMVLYGGYLALELIKQKKWILLAFGSAALVLSIPFVWLITGFKTGTFFYQPLWYIDTMIEAPDRLNYLPWKFEEAYYANTGNWLKVFQIKTQEIAIFFLGNLGVRSVFFALPIIAFFRIRKKQKVGTASLTTAVLGAFLFASIFPLFFLQTGVVWNSIQFWYYALIFANFLAVIVLSHISPSSKLQRFFGLLGIIVVIALATPTYLATVPKKLQNTQALTAEQVAVLSSYTTQDTVLVCPENTDLYNTQLLAANTSARVFLAQTVQLNIVGADEGIKTSYEDIFNSQNEPALRTLLDRENISAVICSDTYYSHFIARALDTYPTESSNKQVDSWLVFTP